MPAKLLLPFVLLLIASACFCLWLPSNPSNAGLALLLGPMVAVLWYGYCAHWAAEDVEVRA